MPHPREGRFAVHGDDRTTLVQDRAAKDIVGDLALQFHEAGDLVLASQTAHQIHFAEQ